MPSMKNIKRKITSVGNTQQIMKAMNLVAASKLQKSKAHFDAVRPIVAETRRVLELMKGREDIAENKYVKAREKKNIAYIVITSDRGLCGGYNVNVVKEVLAHMENMKGRNISVIAVGIKGGEAFRRRRIKVQHRFSGISETALYEDAVAVGSLVSSTYVEGKIDEVYLAYTEFKSTLSHVPCVKKLMPFFDDTPQKYEYDATRYEPDADTFLNQAAQMYINAFIYGAIAEAAVCEQAARMIGMDSASNNAADIIDELSLTYNRLRQAQITQEISEIVSGTNALK